MLFRGRRVLHSRIPLRHITNKTEEQKIENSLQQPTVDKTEEGIEEGIKEANEVKEEGIEEAKEEAKEAKKDESKAENDDEVADCMQIQMAFYSIPKELLMNSDGEVLDSREMILWEGYLFRRVC